MSDEIPDLPLLIQTSFSFCPVVAQWNAFSAPTELLPPPPTSATVRPCWRAASNDVASFRFTDATCQPGCPPFNGFWEFGMSSPPPWPTQARRYGLKFKGEYMDPILPAKEFQRCEQGRTAWHISVLHANFAAAAGAVWAVMERLSSYRKQRPSMHSSLV